MYILKLLYLEPQDEQPSSWFKINCANGVKKTCKRMAELKSNVVEISGGVGNVSSTALDKSAGRELIINAPKKVTVINNPRRFAGRSITLGDSVHGGFIL